MKFLDVEIQNFLAIGQAKVELADQGLVHISGDNKEETSADSNGAGKSSIGDAINWCLYGSCRGLAGDDVINTVAGGETKVTLNILDGKDTYKICRYRKYPKQKDGPVVEANVGGVVTDLTKGTAVLTQKIINQIIGCSQDVFQAAVYSAQEEMPDIPNMTDKQLKNLIEQAANITVFDTAHEIAKERLDQVATALAQRQIAHDRLVDAVEHSKATLKRLQNSYDGWELSRTQVLKDCKKAAIDAVEDVKQARSQINDEERKEVEEKISDTQSKIDAVDQEKNRLKTLSEDYSARQKTANMLELRAEQAERSFLAVSERLKNIESQVGKPCGECGKEYEASDIAQAKSIAENELVQARNEMKETKRKAGQASDLADAAKKALIEHEESMTDVSAEVTLMNHLLRERQFMENLESEVERLKDIALRTADEFKREKNATNPHAMLLKDEQDHHKQAQDRLMQSAEEIKAMREDVDYAAKQVEIFAPSGLRAHRLDEATPFLNERTAHYLGSLSDGAIDAEWSTLTRTKKGEYREKFKVTVAKDGSAPNFKALSGGEKRKVRLACALAVQDLVASRASKNIELWIGDEIDDALDKAGLERLMSILEEKARDRGTVLVISHNDIAHFARKSIMVKKTNGVSEVIIN